MFTIKGFVFEVLCTLLLLQCTAFHHSQVEDACQNEGELLNGNHTKCSCSHGYKGFDCSQKVSPCEGTPCRNSGECLEIEDGTFTCKCSEKYAGLLCEKRVRPCDSQPCQNGGNCSDDGLKCYQCECPDGFKGCDCSKKIMPCEVSPCKNGGICSNEKGASFKCACRNGYGGLVCDQKDALYSSYILDGKVEYIKELQQWLDDESDWRLCYRASRDGWRTGDFHSRCDYKGPTVTIVRVGYYIFGGYSDIAWGGTTGYKQTTNSFLFSLRNKDKLKPFKSPIYRNQGNAIYQNPGYGPTFGGGHDLYVRDNAHTSSGSYTNFGHAYKTPTGYDYGNAKTKALLAGNYNFLATEIEVFYLR